MSDRLPSDADVAYAAGIIDGEGCISIRRRTQKGRVYYNLSVEVVNTNEELLVWLHETFGGHRGQMLRGDEVRKARGAWSLQSVQAAVFLTLIQPYLIVKRAACVNGLSFQAGMKMRGSGYRPAWELERQERHHAESRRLNTRGVPVNAARSQS